MISYTLEYMLTYNWLLRQHWHHNQHIPTQIHYWSFLSFWREYLDSQTVRGIQRARYVKYCIPATCFCSWYTVLTNRRWSIMCVVLGWEITGNRKLLLQFNLVVILFIFWVTQDYFNHTLLTIVTGSYMLLSWICSSWLDWLAGLVLGLQANSPWPSLHCGIRSDNIHVQ